MTDDKREEFIQRALADAPPLTDQQRAYVARILASTPPPGWFAFGWHVDRPGPLEFSPESGEDGLPLWERPIDNATGPRRSAGSTACSTDP